MFSVLLEVHTKMYKIGQPSIAVSTIKLDFESTFKRDSFTESLIKYENVNGIEVNRIVHML